jgi:hypothetical protein
MTGGVGQTGTPLGVCIVWGVLSLVGLTPPMRGVGKIPALERYCQGLNSKRIKGPHLTSCLSAGLLKCISYFGPCIFRGDMSI